MKYYYPEKDYVRFQPANAQMAPILVRAIDFKPTMLLGVVVGVFRLHLEAFLAGDAGDAGC